MLYDASTFRIKAGMSSALLFFCFLSNCTGPHDCNATWRNSTDISVSGLTFYPQYTTIDECLLGCAYLQMGCVAAQTYDASSSVIDCFLVMDTNSLRDAQPSQGGHLYRLTLSCDNNARMDDTLLCSTAQHSYVNPHSLKSTQRLIYSDFKTIRSSTTFDATVPGISPPLVIPYAIPIWGHIGASLPNATTCESLNCGSGCVLQCSMVNLKRIPIIK